MRRVHKRIEHIERIHLYGPMEESEKWLNWLRNGGYRVKRGGPKLKSWSEVDPSSFYFMAEKEEQDANNKVARPERSG